MSWIDCIKCHGALEWGDMYCCHCGAENPQGKKDWESHRIEADKYKGEQEEEEIVS